MAAFIHLYTLFLAYIKIHHSTLPVILANQKRDILEVFIPFFIYIVFILLFLELNRFPDMSILFNT